MTYTIYERTANNSYTMLGTPYKTAEAAEAAFLQVMTDNRGKGRNFLLVHGTIVDSSYPIPPANGTDITPDRTALITALAHMPNEAFGWFAGWASGLMMQYPDGLGGFQNESRTAIAALRKAAEQYIYEAGK